MTQQKPDLQRISSLLNQSMGGMPQAGKKAPAPDDDEPSPGCLDRAMDFTLRLLRLAAIVSLSAFFGAVVTVAIIPPQITLQGGERVVTGTPVVITQTVPMTVTVEPVVMTQTMTTTAESVVTREVPITIEVIKEVPVTVEVIKEVPVTVEVTTAPTLPSPTSGITYANYQRLEKGMTYQDVVGILGREGVETSSSGQSIYYKWEGKLGDIHVSFYGGVLDSKSQYGFK